VRIKKRKQGCAQPKDQPDHHNSEKIHANHQYEISFGIKKFYEVGANEKTELFEIIYPNVSTNQK
jgi:hypothetical protein